MALPLHNDEEGGGESDGVPQRPLHSVGENPESWGEEHRPDYLPADADRSSSTADLYRPEQLKDKEDKALNDAESPLDSSANEEKDSLFNPEQQQSRRQRFTGICKSWKKLAIGGGIGGSTVGGIIALLGAMLPLKLDFIFQGMDEHLDAASNYAIGQRVDAFVGHYFTNRIFATANTNVYIGDTLLATIFGNITAAKFEERLFRETGLSFRAYDAQGRIVQGTNQGAVKWGLHYTSGTDITFQGTTVRLFDMDIDLNARRVRQEIKAGIRMQTRWNQVYKRWHVWRIMKSKLQVPNRLVPHFVTDARASYRAKKLEFKKWIIKRTIGPFSKGLAGLMTCIMDYRTCKDVLQRRGLMGTDELNRLRDEVADLDRQIRELEGSVDEIDPAELDNLKNQLAEKNKKLLEGGADLDLEKLTDEALGAIDPEAEDYRRVMGRIGKIMSSKITQRLLTSIGVIGVLQLLSSIDNGLQDNSIGQGVYGMQVLNVVNAAMPYRTANDQIKMGGLYEDEVGLILESFDNFEQSPLYQIENGILTQDTLAASSLFDGTVSASGETRIPYDCDGDSEISDINDENSVDYVTLSNPVCAHMNLIKDYRLFSDEPWYRNTIGRVLDAYDTIIGRPLGWLADFIGSAFSVLLNPLMDALHITDLLQNAMEYGVSKFVSPACLGSEEGGTAYDCVRAGSEVIANTLGEESLDGIGAPYATPEEYNQVVAYMMDEYQEEWQRQPLFARLFSTTSYRSLLAQAVVRTPSSVGRSMTTIANAVTAPFKYIGSAFSGLFSPVMAASSYAADLPANWNPFGVVHYAYKLGDPNLTAEPGTGVFADCGTAGLQEATENRDNEASETWVDPDGPDGPLWNGTDGPLWKMPAVANYCALEKTALESFSALSSGVEEDNNSVGTTVPIGQDAQTLAQQLLEADERLDNITFENYSPIGTELAICQYWGEPDGKTKTVIPISLGQPAVVCNKDQDPPESTTTVSAELLRILLQAANDGVTLSIKSLTTRDHSPNSEHYVGTAVDLAANAETYRYFYEHAYHNGGNFCIRSMIHKFPPAGTSTMINGVDGVWAQNILNQHEFHIHVSVFSDLSACGR